MNKKVVFSTLLWLSLLGTLASIAIDNMTSGAMCVLVYIACFIFFAKHCIGPGEAFLFRYETKSEKWLECLDESGSVVEKYKLEEDP